MVIARRQGSDFDGLGGSGPGDIQLSKHVPASTFNDRGAIMAANVLKTSRTIHMSAFVELREIFVQSEGIDMKFGGEEGSEASLSMQIWYVII